jgi:DNA invertase Pin-like site-specific DNA recombinase
MIPESPQALDRNAYYGRVSTPKQKLEHQREHVLRWCEGRTIVVPEHHRYEDKEKRHKSAQRERFQALLEECRKGNLDWIIISSFDRWGVADPDEFSDFRRQLRRCDVQLYSVVDQLNLTSINEGDYFRIVALAIGATRYVQQQAEKNILKMIEMAKGGLAATGNAPFATDLVCYPLVGPNVPDVSRPMFRVERVRYIRPAIYRITYPDGRVEVTERMPLRDKKLTGYRFERSLDEDRIKAVNLIFELYESGMSFGDISENLWRQGYKHYDKPFGFHGIETILSNPVYVGQPTWGKSGVGAYYLLQGGQPVRANRKAKDAYVVRKGEGDTVTTFKPTFDPIIPIDLWKRVQAKLAERPLQDPAFGVRRQRSKLKHPLNGKIVCPDCGNPMVIGSSQSKGYIKRYFICGLYRRTIRKQCKANSIPWKTIDDSVSELLETVKDRLDTLTSSPDVAATILQEQWTRETELGRLIARIVSDYLNLNTDAYSVRDGDGVSWVRGGMAGGYLVLGENGPRFSETPTIGQTYFKMAGLWDRAARIYDLRFDESSAGVRSELERIEADLHRIADVIMEGVPSQTVRAKLNQRMANLEARKTELKPLTASVTSTIRVLQDQLMAVRKTIVDADTLAVSRILGSLVEKVFVHFVGELIPGRARPVTLEFVPKETACNFMPQPMKIGDNPKGRGSSRRPR